MSRNSFCKAFQNSLYQEYSYEVTRVSEGRTERLRYRVAGHRPSSAPQTDAVALHGPPLPAPCLQVEGTIPAGLKVRH